MTITASEKLDLLATALVVAKKSFKTPKKSGHNPHFNSQFSTYNDIKEATEDALCEAGLSVSHFPVSLDDRIGIVTILMHASGQFISSTFVMKPVKGGEQDVGKIITYFKRYARAAILGLEGEIDTDGDLVTSETIYVGSDEHKTILKNMFKKHGVDKADDMKNLSTMFLEKRKTFADIEKQLRS